MSKNINDLTIEELAAALESGETVITDDSSVESIERDFNRLQLAHRFNIEKLGYVFNTVTNRFEKIRDIRTLTDEELVEVLSTGGKVEIPDDCSLTELVKIHERLDIAAAAIRTTDMSAIKAKLDELAKWRDEHIPTTKVVADNKNTRVSIFKFKL